MEETGRIRAPEEIHEEENGAWRLHPDGRTHDRPDSPVVVRSVGSLTPADFGSRQDRRVSRRVRCSSTPDSVPLGATRRTRVANPALGVPFILLTILLITVGTAHFGKISAVDVGAARSGLNEETGA